jgi:hypothetical protein
MALPAATPRPLPPEPREYNADEHKLARITRSYKGTWMWPEKPTPFRKRMVKQAEQEARSEARRRAERKPRPTDGQGQGLPEHPDIPF